MVEKTRKRILIIEDEADLVELVKYRLESKGFEILTAFDGEEGLRKAKSEKPDLILLDIMMPKIDGYEVCRLLKTDKTNRNIPIIILTAKALEQDRQASEEAGADAYIAKPFEPEDLIKQINTFLR